MRDLFVTAVVFGSVPLILARPWIGILMWAWISYMNPHKLAWGFAYSMPFAMIIALATLTGLLFSKEPKKFPLTRETGVMLALAAWMVVTTTFAYYDFAWTQFDKVAKILLMTFVTLILINTKERLHAFVWAIALSIGFFGVKGGIFTLLTGGSYRVYGPTNSFIGGNNELALALIMVLPLMRYLQLNSAHLAVRAGLGVAMFLSVVAAIGSYSRGALIAILATAFFFWLKSRGKIATGLFIVLAVAVIAPFMPQSWYDRMGTIENYEQDSSALGRINAWWFAYNLAKARPLVGGGFETFQPELFAAYAPESWRYHDVHSIYFEMLGEHGFVGLGLFLGLALFTWLKASHVARQCKNEAQLKSVVDLVRMVQASLVAYATGGAFLGLAYFDLWYHLVAIVVIVGGLLSKAQQPVSVTQNEPQAIAPLPLSLATREPRANESGAAHGAGLL
jgi:probable O-glycosylation ligase (exosortase A-associated)